MAGDVGSAAVTSEPADESATADSEPAPESAETVVADTRWRKVADSPVRLALTLGVVVVLGLSALAGWLGYRLYQQHRWEADRVAYLQAGRQGALDLSSVDYTRVEADVHRVLEASTGTFHDAFERRSPPFIQEVLRTKTKAVASIAEAGLETADLTGAKVLVAVKVTTTREGSTDQRVKGWRMRISVQRVGGDIKIADVEMIQ